MLLHRRTIEQRTYDASYLEAYYNIDVIIDDWTFVTDEEWELVDEALFDTTCDALHWFVID